MYLKWTVMGGCNLQNAAQIPDRTMVGAADYGRWHPRKELLKENSWCTAEARAVHKNTNYLILYIPGFFSINICFSYVESLSSAKILDL